MRRRSPRNAMRLAATALVLLTFASLVSAAAASINLTPATIGAGSATVGRCTTAGLSVVQNLTAGAVISVTVAGLPAACGGAAVQLTVNNGVTTGSGSATVPAGGGSVTVTLGSSPVVTAGVQTDLVIVGP